eukprot:10514256-Alexandrium_andersonii.AAC.2
MASGTRRGSAMVNGNLSTACRRPPALHALAAAMQVAAVSTTCDLATERRSSGATTGRALHKGSRQRRK